MFYAFKRQRWQQFDDVITACVSHVSICYVSGFEFSKAHLPSHLKTMEFRLVHDFMELANSSDTLGSLYSRRPLIAGPYVAVLGVAAVVGTVGNVVVMTTVAMKHLRSRRHRAETTGNDCGRVLIANLAMSDLIVTALINPLAIGGLPQLCRFFFTAVSR